MAKKEDKKVELEVVKEQSEVVEEQLETQPVEPVEEVKDEVKSDFDAVAYEKDAGETK